MADEVLLGVALAVRGLRLGHVCVDLASVADTTICEPNPDDDLSTLAWPDPQAWRALLAASALVSVDDNEAVHRPLRLVGERLYLDRYWRQERAVAGNLVERAGRVVEDLNIGLLNEGLGRLFPDPEPQTTTASAVAVAPAADGLQRLAAATAALRYLTVIAGGPGTGKTTTIARLLALLIEQTMAAGRRPLRIALAAPTGKAAARLQELVLSEAARLDIDPSVRERLLEVEASTLHRLLGRRPDSNTRFRYNRLELLPSDVVVIDETSMVSLSLMAGLVEAVDAKSRLILVGDPEQLASVEAGAVLGDIVGPAASNLPVTDDVTTALATATGQGIPPTETATAAIGDCVVVLRRAHRYGAQIEALARAVQYGQADDAVALLRSQSPELGWGGRDNDDAAAENGPSGDVRDEVVGAAVALFAAAFSGDAASALTALGASRVLCAHRTGSFGVSTWNERIERWLRDGIESHNIESHNIEGYNIESHAGGAWYCGRPLIVNANDYDQQLFNGDTGVVVRTASGDLKAAFERRGGISLISPARLGDIGTAHAMTIHKSQGSQFDTVTVVLPNANSAILSRELLYTAITRARRRVTLFGSEASLRAGIDHPIARSSGLGERLWR